MTVANTPMPLEFSAIVVIPVYNHGGAIGTMVDGIRVHGVPCLLVDDGSSADCAAVLDQLASAHPEQVSLLRLPVNEGKGGAVMAGLREAARRGYSHALQIDADGQHNPEEIPAFLTEARQYPKALITGCPVYDRSVPKGRLYGRYATHIWVWINTLSFDIRDSMCGYRVYPLASTVALIDSVKIGKRMDFDSEVLVRMHWRGIALRNRETRVTYPLDGVSHFDVLRDNVRISRMHAKMFFGMLIRLPMILSNKMAAGMKSSHWANMGESTFVFGVWFLYGVYRLFGRLPFRLCVYPVVFFYWLTRPVARHASLDYLRNLQADRSVFAKTPSRLTSLRHFVCFAETLLDKTLAMSGHYPTDRVRFEGREAIRADLDAGRGGVIITAHLGCLELLQASASLRSGLKINVLVHTAHAQRFNRILKRLNPQSHVQLLQVTEFSAPTAIMLADRVAAGEMIAIAGDRIPVTGDRVLTLPFLGKPAPFPAGPYLMASLLACPVYLLACQHDGDGYRAQIHKLADQIHLPRASRVSAMTGYAGSFVAWLEERLRESPLDWFNFYPFWDQVPHDAIKSA